MDMPLMHLITSAEGRMQIKVWHNYINSDPCLTLRWRHRIKHWRKLGYREEKMMHQNQDKAEALPNHIVPSAAIYYV